MLKVLSLLLAGSALAGCTASQPDAPTRAAVPSPGKAAAEPAPAEPSPAKAVPAEPPAAAKPEPRVNNEPVVEAESMPYPPGVVPSYNELSGVIVRRQELEGPEAFEGPLSRLDQCAGDPAQCEYPAGVLGFHQDGRVAVIEATTLPGCGGDDDPLTTWGRVARPEALTSAPTTRFKPGKGDPTGAARALQFVKAQANAGFKAPDDLAFLEAGEPLGIDGVTTLVMLREPLAGWLLHATADRVQLVDPTNKTAHLLGEVPPGGNMPSIEQVVVDPTRQYLWVTMELKSGEHCGDRKPVIRRWPLPAGAVKTK